MFKKDPQPKPSSNIKSSERRALLTSVCKEYSITKEDLSKETELSILPITIKQASFQSVQGHKGTIYFDEKEKPLWFKTRDSQLYPSIYTLWQCGGLLPIILTNDHVIDKLSSHANLMLPGSIPPFDSRATKNALVGIASYKTPTVVQAIGHCSLNLTQFDDVVGRQGTAVTVLHVIEDELFNLYDSDIEIPVEVAPYIPTAYDGLNKTLRALYGEDDVDDENENENEVEREDSERCDTQSEVMIEISGQEQKASDQTSAHERELNGDSSVENVSEALSHLSVEDIDNFFVRSFIQLVKLNPLIELPLSASQFMGQYILKNLPKMDVKYCNIKKTSWKKSAKFLKSLEKQKLLQLKGKGDDVSVVSISVPKETVDNFVTHKVIATNKNSSTTGSKSDAANKLSVVLLHKPTNKSRMIYNKVDKSYQKLYTQVELKEIIGEYINIAGLVDKQNPKFLILDEHIKSATGIKEEKVTRDKILQPFTASHSPHYTILKPGDKTIDLKMVHKGTPPKVKILTQTVLGRKTVTTVVNFEPFFIKAATLAEDLKNKCSGSTSVGNSIHNPNLTEVMVQGPHGSTVERYLKEKGVPSSYIEVEDKSKRRKKR